MENFKDSGLHPDIVRGVEALGFETPTPIQKLSIEHLLSESTDLIAFAQTGTGKTAAFSLPILHQLDPEVEHVQAIVLAPTRELCLQIATDIESYSKFMPVKVAAVYGGAPITKQIKELQARPQIVVGTPGRTLDLIERRKLRIEDVQFLVLDEADEMLSMGFQDELDAILANTPEYKQTLLFSATMPDGMKKLTAKYLNDPKEISAGKKNISASNVTHQLYITKATHSYEALRRLLDFQPHMYGIVFCRTRRETQSIAEQLVGDGYRAEALHGDLSQAQRDEVMGRFRKKSLSVLVATDVAARGIDVSDLTHVININIPDDPEVYVHRSGRTGRAGASGVSVVITHGRNMRKVQNLERTMGKTFEHCTVPSGEAICNVKMHQAIDHIINYEDQSIVDPVLLDEALDKLAHLSKAELIERFLGHETSTILSRYRGATDINERAQKSKEQNPKRKDGSEAGFKTVVVDLGYRHKVNPSRLMGLINDNMDGKKIRIGKIDMDKTFSRIDVEERYAADIAIALNGAQTGSYTVNAYFEEGSSSPRASRPAYNKGKSYEKRGDRKFDGERKFDNDRRSDAGDRPKGRTRIAVEGEGKRYNEEKRARSGYGDRKFNDRSSGGFENRRSSGGRFGDDKKGSFENRGGNRFSSEGRTENRGESRGFGGDRKANGKSKVGGYKGRKY